MADVESRSQIVKACVSDTSLIALGKVVVLTEVHVVWSNLVVILAWCIERRQFGLESAVGCPGPLGRYRGTYAGVVLTGRGPYANLDFRGGEGE